MKDNSIGITTATIKGLNEKVYYFEHKCFWAWDIKFENYPLFTFNDLCWLYMGDTEEEAKKARRIIKKIFDNNYIFDDSKVAILYDNDGVIAIGKSNEDCWIDVRDSYKVKCFKELITTAENIFVNCN